MKKRTLLFWALISAISILSYSCNNETHIANHQAISIDTFCDCSKLSKLNKKIVFNDSIKYNGSCFVKDNHDSIIEIRFYNNGELLRRLERKRVYGPYITKFDMTFDQNEMYLNGFEIKLLDEKYDDTEITRVSSSKIWKDGKKIIEYTLNLSYWEGQSFSFSLKYKFKDGKEIKYPLTNEELGQPKCLNNSEYEKSYVIANRDAGVGDFTGTSSFLGDNWRQVIDLTDDSSGLNQAFQILECLKSELPNFKFIRKK
jgi:hypothetical protein